MDLAILSANLRRIRTAKSMNQGEVAEAAELSRAGYRNIEAGTAAPRVDSLVRVARVLGVRLEDLLVPVRELRAVRFRADKKMNTRSEILADLARWIDDYNELEELLEKKQHFVFANVASSLDASIRGLERAKQAASIARSEVGLDDKSKKESAIRDICGLLEDNGVKVFTPSRASEGFFGLSVAGSDGGPAIVVNTWDRLSVERWIFTAAHELGHLILHLNSYNVDETVEDKDQEKEADTFASYFLMPETLFGKEFDEARGLSLVRLVMKLKRIFRVSCTSVVYRIASRSSNPHAIWVHFRAEYEALTGRKLDMTAEPDGLAADEFRARPLSKLADEPEHLDSADFMQDRLHRLVRLAVEEQQISMSRAAEILRLNLDDMRALANSWVQM
jgi:Zn-dependent peptidase ImmA (M78 family)/DNA-binding XRE family transcriptional regulator